MNKNTLFIIPLLFIILICLLYSNFSIPYELRSIDRKNNRSVKSIHIGDRIKNIIVKVRNDILSNKNRHYQNYSVDAKMLGTIIHINEEYIDKNTLTMNTNDNKLIIQFYTLNKDNKQIGFYILKYTQKQIIYN